MNIENCGEQFDLKKFQDARLLTMKIVEEVALCIKPGMAEKEAIDILNQKLVQNNFEKSWHPTKFRLGKNTLKSFREISEEVYLEENDMFFIDVGPVFFNHEADYGDTFVIGKNEEMLRLKNSAKIIFQKVENYWRENKVNGKELFAFADNEAKKLNYELNANMSGHRLGDFPHALYYKGGLFSIDITPAPNLWVLEIHIRDNELKRGAFFEDVLI